MSNYNKKDIKYLDHNELEKIIYSFKIDSFIDVRNLLLLYLILDCGLRLSEIVNLKYNDFDFYHNIIKIDGREEKQRYVPLSDTLYKILELYTILCIDDYYLTGKLLKNDNGENIAINNIISIFKNISKKSNIDVHPNILRHTFAINFLLNGGDLENLKIMLGHKSFYMSINYFNFIKGIKKTTSF